MRKTFDEILQERTAQRTPQTPAQPSIETTVPPVTAPTAYERKSFDRLTAERAKKQSGESTNNVEDTKGGKTTKTVTSSATRVSIQYQDQLRSQIMLSVPGINEELRTAAYDANEARIKELDNAISNAEKAYQKAKDNLSLASKFVVTLLDNAEWGNYNPNEATPEAKNLYRIYDTIKSYKAMRADLQAANEHYKKYGSFADLSSSELFEKAKQYEGDDYRYIHSSAMNRYYQEVGEFLDDIVIDCSTEISSNGKITVLDAMKKLAEAGAGAGFGDYLVGEAKDALEFFGLYRRDDRGRTDSDDPKIQELWNAVRYKLHELNEKKGDLPGNKAIIFDDVYSALTGDEHISEENIESWLGDTVTSGLGQFNAGVSSTLQGLFGKPLQELGWENNPISEVDKHYSEEEKRQQYEKELNAQQMSLGSGMRLFGDFLTGLTGAAPDAALAFMTAGASKGATMTTTALRSTAARATSNLMTKVGLTAQTMMKNPHFWTSFARTYGKDYQHMLDNGASDVGAVFAAMFTSMINAGIEIGIDGKSGIQGLTQDIANGKYRRLIQWIESSLQEGGEELLQGYVTDGMTLMINPNAQTATLQERLKEGALGVGIGGALGGASVIQPAVDTVKGWMDNGLQVETAPLKGNAESVDTHSSNGDMVVKIGAKEADLKKFLERNGFVDASISISNIHVDDFGPISFILKKDALDTKAGRRVRYYKQDAWTPQEMDLKINPQFDAAKTAALVERVKQDIGPLAPALFNVTPEQFAQVIRENDGSMLYPFSYLTETDSAVAMMTAFAVERGYLDHIPTTSDGKVDVKEVKSAIKDITSTDSVWREYRQWLRELSDEIIPNYDKPTSQDIHRNMMKQNPSGKAFRLSKDGKLITPAKEYASLDEMAADINTLSADADAQAAELGQRMLIWANDLAARKGVSKKLVTDSINSSFDLRNEVDAVLELFQGDGVDISQQEVAELQAFYQEAENLPARYREAKAEEFTSKEDVMVAIIPSNLDPMLKQQLQDAGVPVAEYNENDPGAQERLEQQYKQDIRSSQNVENDAGSVAAVEQVNQAPVNETLVLDRAIETTQEVAGEKTYVNLEEFANQNASVWNNVDYADEITKAQIMQNTHNAMVSEGKVVKVADDTMAQVEQHFPDLRGTKKKERTPILKDAMNVLKKNLRSFLNGFKNQSFEFEVNGKILEAKLYSTGINEVMEKVTQEKADMLYSTPVIFQNARYLYSTQDSDGDPNVYRWNYFYTPVQIGENTVGVRIAVRDLAKNKTYTPESQIYNWGIKKGASLDGVRLAAASPSHGVSSDVPANSISKTKPIVKSVVEPALEMNNERAVEGARPYNDGGRIAPVSEAQVLERAVEATKQGRAVTQAADVDGIIAELGEDAALRRLYNATQLIRPTGTVEIDGQTVDADAYTDAYEQTLPEDSEALEQEIHRLEKLQAAEIVREYQEGNVEEPSPTRLKINLQLFAAKRKWDLLQIEPGPDGKKARRFYENRLKGEDQIHSDELMEVLSGRSETYDPVSNKKTLAKAEQRLRDPKYEAKLLRKLGRDGVLLNSVEVAAATIRAKDAYNEGNLDAVADIYSALARRGTELGRAVQALSIIKRLTPEGALVAATRTLKAEADYVIGEGANEGLDVLTDDLAENLEKRAKQKALEYERQAQEYEKKARELADRVKELEKQEQALRKKRRRRTQTAEEEIDPNEGDEKPAPRRRRPAKKAQPQSQEMVPQVPPAVMDLLKNLDPNDGHVLKYISDEYLTDEQRLAKQRAIEEETARQLPPPLPPVMSRTELVNELARNLAAEPRNYLTRDEIYDEIWKTVEECTNIPEQVKRYVLKKIRKNDGSLAERIYQIYLKGDMPQLELRRAMEEALELPSLSAEDVKTMVDMATRVQELSNDPVAQAEAMEEMYDFLGSKMAVNWMDRLQAWRKFGMLANVKTHLRNVCSNYAFTGVRAADDFIAMGLERLFHVKPTERAAFLGWSHTNHGQSLMPRLKERAELAALEMQKKGAKYETGTGQLKSHRKFFGKSKVGEKLNTASKWNSTMLEVEDLWTFKPAYINALGQLMTARKATSITPQMHELAMKRALDATFRADNMLTDVISSLKKFQNANTTGKRLFGQAVDVVIPFHKTPANIAAQSVLHSPVGIAKGAFDLWNATRGKGSKDAATAINTMAKGITGTALYGIAILLGYAGLIRTGYGKTDKERDADELAGAQQNALIIGDLSISLDWLQPAAAPLISGAAVGESLAEGDISLGTVFGAAAEGADSLFELSMLQSLYDVFGGYDAGATGSLVSVGENVLSQSIPTLVGQLARAVDPVQRETQGDNAFETALNQVLAKIPGLTYLLDPKLDVWGNEVYRTGQASGLAAGVNAVQQPVTPWNTKIGTGADDPVSQEILRLYEELETTSVIPSTITRDEAKDEGLDYVEDNRLLGAVNRSAVEDFINDQWAYQVQETLPSGKKRNVTKYYSEMTDDERRRVLSRIYTRTKKMVKEQDAEDEKKSKSRDDRYFEELLEEMRKEMME